MPLNVALLFGSPDEVIRQLKTLPSNPSTLPDILKLVDSPHSQVEDLVGVIRLDRALTSRILQAANSVVYGVSGTALSTVEEAVQRIGFVNVRQLTLTMIGLDPMVHPLPTYGLDARTHWRRSVSCALAMEALASIKGQNENEAYVIGLLHSIGSVVVDMWVQSKLPGTVFKRKAWPEDWRGEEVAVVGFDTAEAGAALLRSWGMPQQLIGPVRFQFKARNVPQFGMAACMLYVSRWLRPAILEGAERLPRLEIETLAGLGLSEADLQEMVPDIRARLDKLASSLGY